MRKRNKVKQLNRTASHRRAMLRNMAVSLIEHERIVTTRARGKVLRSYAEKLITRARRTTSGDLTPERQLHERRMVLRDVSDQKAVAKLFTELAERYKDRNGGYTRIVHLPERQSDSAQMSIVELIDRKEKIRRKALQAAGATTKSSSDDKKKSKKGKEKPEEKGTETQVDSAKKKDEKKGKWWRGFRKKKGDEHS